MNRGAAYQKLLETDAALSDYSKAIQLDKTNANVYLYRGFLYYKRNDHPEALKDFNAAIDLLAALDLEEHLKFRLPLDAFAEGWQTSRDGEVLKVILDTARVAATT